MAFTVFAGYDAREDLTYRVMKHSLERRASIPVNVVPLDHMSLRRSGMYRRTFEVQESGQMIDKADGKPFSTAFSFSRFLVPEIARQAGVRGPCMFVDCDWLFLDDIALLLQDINPEKPISVVKHRFEPNYTSKMDGIAQTVYSKKLWSSLMVINHEHPANYNITTDRVNVAPGSWLHGFGWLDLEDIGEISEAWNWLPRHSPTIGAELLSPKGIHFTDGSPQMPAWRNQPYADLWFDELRDFARRVGRNPMDLI